MQLKLKIPLQKTFMPFYILIRKAKINLPFFILLSLGTFFYFEAVNVMNYTIDWLGSN